MYQLTLPNGKSVEADESKKYIDVLKEHFPDAIKSALAVALDDTLYDLTAHITSSGVLQTVTFEEERGKKLFWHSSAHVLAQAILRLYPETKFDDGPALLSGPGHFYYDIFCPHKISEEDFATIEAEIKKITKENYPISRRELPREEALDFFKNKKEIFKVDIIEHLPQDAVISLYKQGEFEDLCRGPHVTSTKKLGHFKLTAVSGAYWKGDAEKPMLQRIYGVSFPTKEELDAYIFRVEEAKKRDHRKLGKELELFTFMEEGPGFPFYLPNGSVLFNTMSEYIRRQCDLRGYQEIRTPTMLSDELWDVSGHNSYYRENMYYSQIDDKGYAIKPMNCPGSNLLYRSVPRSYRDLPLRFAELGTVHRHEMHGVLHGLFRARAFTQDDAHVYATPEQVQKEIQDAVAFTVDVYRDFGFDKVQVFIATRPEKAIGDDDVWQEATKLLEDALDTVDMPFKIKEGEGAFYGPKIEFNVEDSLGRNWQLGTIQIDFFLPERFHLEYVGADGNKHRPVMLHRAILGSLERFIGILIEHYAGKFPLWLSPVQIAVLSVHESQNEYCQKIKDELIKEGFRVFLDTRNEKIGYKIREWTAKKINYAVIIGKNEAEKNSLSLRARGEQKTVEMSLQELIDFLKKESHF